MGLMGSVVKYIAKYKALEDDKRASEILETATISIVVIVGLFLAIASPLFEYAIIYAIPTESISEGVKILPLAILSLWINSIAGVFLSGLDGCQRMDLKSIIID
jgi:O-antigen/teichoic acid export membrane protein